MGELQGLPLEQLHADFNSVDPNVQQILAQYAVLETPTSQG